MYKLALDVLIPVWAIALPCWVVNGLGRHVWDVPNHSRTQANLTTKMYLVICELLYAFALFFAKMAILAFYWRMFRVTSIKLPIQILTVCSIIWIIIRTFLVTLRCIPLQSFWDPSVKGKCTLKDSTFFFGTILVHVIIDIVILILPVLQIRKLQLPLMQRLGIIAMFMFGIVVCASGMVIVVVSTSYDDHSDDMTWNLTPIFLWATVEVNLVTVSACLPTIRPACNYIFSCGNPASTIGSGSHSYDRGYGRTQAKQSIRLSAIPKSGEADEASSTRQLADNGDRSSLSDFESHALDRYTGNTARVTGPDADGASEDYHEQPGFHGIMVKNETTIQVATTRIRRE
ncbi:integral membrane pth11 [Fusarium albosuccineum]|uniref:Integral membrane pth11 n=1 Tax=Fusarium albosuccineum TaxID=1237068 RepID=A0A8H4PEB6_9HYPO|nr:integral membrane pth11 [Fusarium albosuccineum]